MEFLITQPIAWKLMKFWPKIKDTFLISSEKLLTILEHRIKSIPDYSVAEKMAKKWREKRDSAILERALGIREIQCLTQIRSEKA